MLLIHALLVSVVAGQACNLKYFGTNLAGADFGDGGGDHVLNPNPGTYGTNYSKLFSLSRDSEHLI
jgi:hypothetical protein